MLGEGKLGYSIGVTKRRIAEQENFSNLSVPRSGSSSWYLFTLALNAAFRTSGSLALSANVSSVGRVLSGLRRNSGPTSSSSPLACLRELLALLGLLGSNQSPYISTAPG